MLKRLGERLVEVVTPPDDPDVSSLDFGILLETAAHHPSMDTKIKAVQEISKRLEQDRPVNNAVRLLDGVLDSDPDAEKEAVEVLKQALRERKENNSKTSTT